MKQFIFLLLVAFSLPVFAELSEEQILNNKDEIIKAVSDYTLGRYNEEGSEIYKMAMDEMEVNSVKTDRHGHRPPPPPPHRRTPRRPRRPHHHPRPPHNGDDVVLGVFAGILGSIFTLATLDSSDEEYVTACRDNCQTWDELSYAECKTECYDNPMSHL